MAETIESVDVARAVLNEAKSGGFMDSDLPEAEEDIIEQANYWFEEAQKAYEAGMRHETVIAILNCADGLPDGDTEKKWKAAVHVKNPGYSSGVPPKSSGGYSESDLREVHSGPIQNKEGVQGPTGVTGALSSNVANQYNLPVPGDWEGELIEMPRDISEVSDKEVRRLSGAYNAYLARVKWLLAIEISDLASVAHLRDAAFRKSLKNVDKVDPETRKSKLKELIDAEAKENPEYLNLDDSVKFHQDRVTKFKALQEIYSGNIDRLSREWTMRQDEYEKTR